MLGVEPQDHGYSGMLVGKANGGGPPIGAKPDVDDPGDAGGRRPTQHLRTIRVKSGFVEVGMGIDEGERRRRVRTAGIRGPRA